ncbi:MAG TPA: RNA polymerase sigma factor [Noviherbaspirillum sp.]
MHDHSAELIACIPRLRRYARALVGDRTAADDLVQDTLERAWSKLGLWQRGTDMRAWLFGIMHNIRINQVRKPVLPTVPLEEEDIERAGATTENGRLDMRDLESALKLLPVEQREVLLLVALENLTYEEVAVALGIPSGTVMSRLARGREKLRAIMEGTARVSPLKVVK